MLQNNINNSKTTTLLPGLLEKETAKHLKSNIVHLMVS